MNIEAAVGEWLDRVLIHEMLHYIYHQNFDTDRYQKYNKILDEMDSHFWLKRAIIERPEMKSRDAHQRAPQSRMRYFPSIGHFKTKA